MSKKERIIKKLNKIDFDKCEVFSLSDVAKEIGCSREFVRQVAMEIGFKGRYKPLKIECSQCHLKVLKYSIKNKICRACNSINYKQRLKLWSPKYYLFACVSCGRSDIRHVCNGRCGRCYQKEKYEKCEHYKAMKKKCTNEWKRENPTKYKKYQVKYYKKNKKKILEYASLYYRKNKK